VNQYLYVVDDDGWEVMIKLPGLASDSVHIEHVVSYCWFLAQLVFLLTKVFFLTLFFVF